MTATVTFEQIFAGPADTATQALDALAAAGLVAATITNPYAGDGDTNTWIQVLPRPADLYNTDPTDADAQTAWMGRAADALTDCGYELRLHGLARTTDGQEST